MVRISTFVAAVSLLSMTALAADAPTTGASDAKDAGQHAAIQAQYDKLCKSCHGADGKGNPKKATTLKVDASKLDLTRADAQQMSRDDKKKILTDGKEKMPAYGKKLPGGELDQMLDFVEGLQKASGAPAAK